jgi:hypothetical protein
LSAFDSSNNLLGALAIPNQVGSLSYPYSGFYSLAFSGISKVTLSANAGDWIVLDNVTVGPAVAAIPEPESYAMLLAGLGCMGLIARRRKA